MYDTVCVTVCVLIALEESESHALVPLWCHSVRSRVGCSHGVELNTVESTLSDRPAAGLAALERTRKTYFMWQSSYKSSRNTYISSIRFAKVAGGMPGMAWHAQCVHEKRTLYDKVTQVGNCALTKDVL